MGKHRRRKRARSTPALRPGKVAQAAGQTLNSYRLGALPIINRLLKRMRLEEFLEAYLPPEDGRSKIPSATVLLVLLKNLLLSRGPLYGVGEWAAQFAPEVLGLSAEQLRYLNDDRAGRGLDGLFVGDWVSLLLAVVTHVVREFVVELDEFHNDSTTISFYGAYAEAGEEKQQRGQKSLAITWGHNKDHRPDLKQLLYILTVSKDGGVPVHFRLASGNVVDDQTHQATWDLLWYHSTRKAQCDACARQKQLERALGQLAALRQKLSSPRTRYRQAAKVSEAVTAILEACGATPWIVTQIQERTLEKYHQERRGRPNKLTRYVKDTSTRFDLTYHLDHEQLASAACSDGTFPLITNAVSLSEQEVLLAYKGQPVIEKRFSQLKTDYEVAPVFLKNVRRVQALLCVYFFALLTEALLERELRRAMAREGIEHLPLYPEGRPCRRPTTQRLLELFDNVERHTLVVGDQPPVVFTTELTRLQHKLLALLRMPPTTYDP